MGHACGSAATGKKTNPARGALADVAHDDTFASRGRIRAVARALNCGFEDLDGGMAIKIVVYLIVPVALGIVLRRTMKWAIQGEGYWPRGLLGAALALIFILGSPFVVLAFLRGLECKTPMYWVIPPLHGTRAEDFPTRAGR
jgi:hypothetical protein